VASIASVANGLTDRAKDGHGPILLVA